MATRYPPREDDDRILEMVRLRTAGKSTRDIAAHFGVTQQLVSAQTTKTMQEDLAHSGEPFGVVRAGYWA